MEPPTAIRLAWISTVSPIASPTAMLLALSGSPFSTARVYVRSSRTLVPSPERGTYFAALVVRGIAPQI